MVTDLATQLVLVLATGLLIYAAVAVRRVNRTCAECARELQRAQWLEWWVRNAAEMTPLDPSRVHFKALAYAAQLAPSLTVFAADCRLLTVRPDAPEGLRTAAAAYVAELHAPRVPWEVWVEETGKPPHAPTVIAQRYADAISSTITSVP